jgi:hypothetical protein
MEKTNFHKQLINSRKGNVTENKVISFIVVGAMVGIGIPILYQFFADWATDTEMPAWLITAGPAFLGLGVLIIIVALARK